jgi:hypothetical protein
MKLSRRQKSDRLKSNELLRRAERVRRESIRLVKELRTLTGDNENYLYRTLQNRRQARR